MYIAACLVANLAKQCSEEDRKLAIAACNVSPTGIFKHEQLEAPLNIRHCIAALFSKQGAISSTLPSALPSESQL